MGAGASTDIGPQIAGASDADLKTALDALTAEQREKLTGALSSVAPRSDPPHDIFKSYAQVQEQMKEYLAKEPYEVEVGINKVKVKLHHNPKGATEHTNIMSKVLTEELYNQMAARITKNGITFGKVIQTGVQNPGHPTITTVGAVAGDAECFETFKEFFDPVISLRHNGYAADAKHPSDLDYSKLHKFEPNEKDAARIRSTRVRTGRSLSGLPLPPSCNKAERREIEEKITTSLLTMEGDLKGDYYPLSGSQSYGAKLGGMSAEEEEQFRTDHFLFQEPDSTLLISGAMHRDWPDARGMFVNDKKNALVWVNEEDHMRVISMEMGHDIVNVFKRFVDLCNNVETAMKAKSGTTFSHSEHLGYILTCPSNLGTGMRASMMITLPLIGAHEKFGAICKKYGLQARGASGVDSAFTGQFDLSNSDRLGKSEVELCNCMIDGITALLQMENKLEAKESIDELLAGL
jgi:creatine kinase